MKLTRGASLFVLLGGGSAYMLPAQSSSSSSSALHMGLFDGFKGMGSGKDDLDEQWERQQEILKNRRKPQAEREQYFNKVAQRRAEATAKQEQMWAWQKKSYAKGEDPLDEWKKRRADGSISDLDNQYGDPKKIGGIPLPIASFGVGGEFGVGGKFDNGGRFDLRLPYAEQGYVDDDSDVMGKLSSFFGGKKEKKDLPPKEEPPKKKSWPW
ncbi:hypothetical protein FisN_13Lh155 [Fistulifera solaris]|uniref:Uncharacterized protein n=1 Tax=Fistulifera solaris TaxID=1519565 RepID=A0A1Z5KM84_FISSO|nr:hypothetical protein FisN_13Lh155 [Fistulifera solaris]|eukprot:GAX27277.1 hypothetical protein FisN_13Lh155 [Fistulifera solaris]